MKRSIVKTSEGIDTVWCESANENFHSLHGALQESIHVFIRNGLMPSLRGKSTLSVLEIGFGTGLNAILTQKHAEGSGVLVKYDAVERDPLDQEIFSQLNFRDFIGSEWAAELSGMHKDPWEVPVKRGSMVLRKFNFDATEKLPAGRYDLVYFDAFSPRAQPQLWSGDLFQRIRSVMLEDGLLVSYCVKGSVLRTLRDCGFEIHKLPGPQGKREMLQAVKRSIKINQSQ